MEEAKYQHPVQSWFLVICYYYLFVIVILPFADLILILHTRVWVMYASASVCGDQKGRLDLL